MAIFSLCLHMVFLCLCSNLLVLLGHQSNWLKVHSYDLTRSFVVKSLSRVQFFMTPRTAARQVSLSFTISRSLLKLMFIESVMLTNHLILCHPLVLLPSIFPLNKNLKSQINYLGDHLTEFKGNSSESASNPLEACCMYTEDQPDEVE